MMHSTTLFCFLGLVATSLVQSMPIGPYHHQRRGLAKKAAAGNPKTVVAHHMVGNTAPYTQNDWLSDINQAHAAGIDAFALNIGTDDWQPKQVASAYAAAQQSGTGFKLFISFDMTVLPCATADQAGTLRNYIKTYAKHPNQLMFNGKSFASTFSGDQCKFGAASATDGWKSQFTAHPDVTGAGGVHFVPAFFVDPGTFGTYSGAINGMFNWNSGWPVSLTAQSVQSSLGGLSLTPAVADIGKVVSALAKYIGVTDTDTQYVNGLKTMTSSDGAPTYMGAVSPWFFTHYGPDSFNKNWIYLADSHLYPTRWDNIVKSRDMFDLVEICTWNDFGESHYIGPIHGAQPNSQAWVNGFDHTAWLDMTNYFATGYKTGKYPAITQDKIYLWARPHPSNANSPDPVGKPTNYQLDQDALWAVVFATAPGTVTLYTSDTAKQTFQVTAGVNKLSMPLTPGGYMRGTLARGGQTVVDLKPAGYTFTAKPQTYNYNAFTAFSSGTGGAAPAPAAPGVLEPAPPAGSATAPAPSGSAALAPSGSAAPIPSGSAALVPSDSAAPVPTDSADPVPSGSAAVAPTDSALPVPTDSDAPLPSDSVATGSAAPTDTSASGATSVPAGSAAVPTDASVPVATSIPTGSVAPLPPLSSVVGSVAPTSASVPAATPVSAVTAAPSSPSAAVPPPA